MIIDIIKNRRAVFPIQFNDQPVTKVELSLVLEAANWAPTHKRTEPWRFKVLQGDSKKDLGLFLRKKYEETEKAPKKTKLKKLVDNPNKSAAVIAICMQRDAQECVPDWEEVAAVAMAVQNMWLCASSMGIGGYWSSPGLIQYMDEFFELNEGERCLGFFYLGRYDGDIPEGIRGPWEEKVVWM